MRKPHILLLPLGLAATLIACSTVGETGRRQVNLMGESKVAAMGLTEFNEYKQQHRVSNDRTKNAAVQRVARRLVPVVSLENAQWEFVVFEDNTPNAFALPGGKVGINTGIFQIARDDAGLATIISHELAHITSRHGNERLSQGILADIGRAALGAAMQSQGVGAASGVLDAYGTFAKTGVLLPFSRKQELEADTIGMRYMARAGYDPAAAVKFWKDFSAYNARQGSSRTSAFLSTHPLDSQRIDNLEKELPIARAQLRR